MIPQKDRGKHNMLCLRRPLWRIEQSAALPFTLLSVMTEVKLND